MSTPWLRQLAALFPRGVVATDAETLSAHAGDAWFARMLPQAVVFPRKAEDVATLLRFANLAAHSPPRLAEQDSVTSVVACRNVVASSSHLPG